MEQNGLTAKDLIPIFRARARVSEVLAKKRRLDLPMIRRLHKRLSIPFESLMREYKLKTAKAVQSRRRSATSKTARSPRSRSE